MLGPFFLSPPYSPLLLSVSIFAFSNPRASGRWPYCFSAQAVGPPKNLSCHTPRAWTKQLGQICSTSSAPFRSVPYPSVLTRAVLRTERAGSPREGSNNQHFTQKRGKLVFMQPYVLVLSRLVRFEWSPDFNTVMSLFVPHLFARCCLTHHLTSSLFGGEYDLFLHRSSSYITPPRDT